MRLQLDKERLLLYLPSGYTALKLSIVGPVKDRNLAAAIIKAVRNVELLNCRIVIDDDKVAYYETTDAKSNYKLRILTDAYWKDVIKEQESFAFDIDGGELIRFFYLKDSVTEDNRELLIMAHPLAGDAESLLFLVKDIFLAMTGHALTPKPINMYCMQKLPHGSGLPLPLTLKLKNLCKIWEGEDEKFSYLDYLTMCGRIYKKQETFVLTEVFSKTIVDHMEEEAMKHKVSVESILQTAFFSIGRSLQLPVKLMDCLISLRTPDYESMGNYNTHIYLEDTYDETLSFMKNVEKVYAQTQEIEKDKKKKYFNLQILDNMLPDMMDGMNFDLYTMFEYSLLHDPMELMHLTNQQKNLLLSTIFDTEIPMTYGSYTIDHILYIPPLLTQARRVIGLQKQNGKIIMTLHGISGKYENPVSAYFADVADFIKSTFEE